tara:strand:+ start:131 stop:823 length:693 start_codon:yes stop_codon:yes gene_type:complete
MIGLVVVSDWISNNVQIYPFNITSIMFRIAVFCFILGVWIGYFKLILAIVDKNKPPIFSIFQSFYLLPKVLLARLLSYCTMIPVLILIINKFPYDINKYDTNIEQYFSDLLSNISIVYSDEISRNLYFAYFNYNDIIILILLMLLPIFFTLRFWCLEIILIDNECSIKEGLIISYALTKSVYQFILLAMITSVVNIAMMFCGFVFFILSLTISYIVIFKYYRLLLNKTKL